jgi:hypothetical protein
MADGRSARIISTGGNPSAGGYGTTDELTYEGVVGTGGLTITTTVDIKSGTKGEGVLLVILAAIESDGSGTDIDSFDIVSIVGPDSTVIPNNPALDGCWRCYPNGVNIDFQASNGFGTPSPVPCGFGTYVFQDIPAGSTITLEAPSAGSVGSFSVLNAIQTVAVVFTRPLAAPAGTGVVGIGNWWYSNYYGARYDGHNLSCYFLFDGVRQGAPCSNGIDPPVDPDCAGSHVSLDDMWNANNNGPFSIASDIGVVLGAAKAINAKNADSTINFYSAYKQPIALGTVGWDFTDIIRFTGTLTQSVPELPSGSFFPTWSISFGFKRPLGASPVGFTAQWACLGHHDFVAGPDTLTFYYDADVGVYVATIAGGTGMPCCARGLIVSDRFRYKHPVERVAGA